MKKLLSVLIAAGLLASCSSNKAMDVKTPEQVKAALLKDMPNLPPVDSITQSPVNGLYQLSINKNIYYVSTDAKTLVVGNMIDVATKANLTEKAAQELNKFDWNKLPLDKALKIVKGDGSRKFALFSDPQCPYCQVFENDVVKNLDNVTVYLYIYPLPFHDKALPYSKEILCSSNPTATWDKWMTTQGALLKQKPTGKAPAPLLAGTEAAVAKACSKDKLAQAEATLAGMKEVSNMVVVNGTPTIVFPNGQVLPGALPLDQFKKALDEANNVATKEDASAAK